MGWYNGLLLAAGCIAVSALSPSAAFATNAAEPGTVNVVGDGATPSIVDFIAQQRAPSPIAKALGTITNSGTVSYSTPIQLPPALLAPQLSLDYQSGARTDFDVGHYGWSLSGLMTLSRVSERYYGHHHPTEERYRVGGLGMLKPTGVVGEWTLVRTTGAPVLAYHDAVLDIWTIQSGGTTSTLEYFSSANTHRMVEQEDPYGNVTEYFYDTTGRVTQILFGGTHFIPHFLRVHFYYQTATNTRHVMVDGVRTVHDRILDSIVVEHDDIGGWTPLWEYVLDTSAMGGVDVVDAIRRVGYRTPIDASGVGPSRSMSTQRARQRGGSARAILLASDPTTP